MGVRIVRRFAVAALGVTSLAGVVAAAAPAASAAPASSEVTICATSGSTYGSWLAAPAGHVSSYVASPGGVCRYIATTRGESIAVRGEGGSYGTLCLGRFTADGTSEIVETHGFPPAPTAYAFLDDGANTIPLGNNC
jgi:hypothetical protein